MKLSPFKSNTKGSMTMEFMVMVPILLMWFAGLFVFFQGFHGWMKATKATYSISDMISRQTQIDNAFIAALDGIFDSISQSEDNSQSWIRITSVHHKDGVTEVLWSEDSAPVLQPDPTISELSSFIPTMIDNEYLFLVETFRPFTPVFDWVGLDPITFGNQIASPLRFAGKLINPDYPEESSSSDEGVDDDDPTEEEDPEEGT